MTLLAIKNTVSNRRRKAEKKCALAQVVVLYKHNEIKLTSWIETVFKERIIDNNMRN